MKKIIIALLVLSSSGLAMAQWDWGSGGGTSGGTSGGSSGGTSGGTGGGTVTGGATSGSGGGTTGGASKAPEVIVPTIGTHYDDSAMPHYEPPHVNNDGRPGMEEAVVVPYPYLREADVKYKKRIWRNIDTRQKLNKSFTWPKQPITQVLYDLATKGLVRAYWTDSLDRLITPEDAYKQGSKLVVTQKQNPMNPDDPTDLIDTAYYDIFRWDRIVKFQVMEDWIFDYKHSEFRPRIIAIAPLYAEVFNGRSFELPLFWLKMDDCRPTLAKCEVYNRYNDALRISFDDLFNHYRLFDSYIVKETDWDDRYIAQKPEFMQDNLGALLEADKIKNDLFIFEHDLWEY